MDPCGERAPFASVAEELLQSRQGAYVKQIKKKMTVEPNVESLNPLPAAIHRTARNEFAANISWLMRSLYRMTGLRTSVAFLVTIPVGLVLGGVEVATAYVLYLVLVEFHVLSPSEKPEWLSISIDPLIMLAVSVILTSLLRYTVQVLPSVANAAFECRIRTALAHAALDGVGEGGTLSVAETSHLINTVTPKSGLFLFALTTSFGVASVLVLVLAQLTYLSWKLTLLAMAITALFGAPILLLKRIYSSISDRAYACHREFGYRFLKDARNVLFLKVCGLNRYEAQQLGNIALSARKNLYSYQMLFAIGTNLPMVAGALMIGGLLWLNAHFAVMPMAELVPFIYLLNRVAGSSVSLSTATGQIRELFPYVVEFLGYDKILFPEVIQARIDGRRIPKLSKLEVVDLGIGRYEVLTSCLSFSVRAGEMTLISGPSGRGKTTLLMTLLGLIPPLSGGIKWDGLPLASIDVVELRRQIGFAGSEPYLIDADIRTNLLFGLESSIRTEAEIDHALEVSCAEFVHDLEGGLAYQLRENGDGISAGQKQRLALARCILRRPEVLFLDEATANLDELTERAFFERLFKFYPNMMVIAVSHRSSLRAFASSFVEI
jgi:ATP-binding cassette subfamily B protein